MTMHHHRRRGNATRGVSTEAARVVTASRKRQKECFPMSGESVRKIDDGGPAFPGGDGQYAGNPQYYTPGMSLRDYFAAKAMQGLYAGRSSTDIPNSELSKWFVEEAYGIADRMLAARKTGGGA